MLGKVLRKTNVNNCVFKDFMRDFSACEECLDVLKYEPVSVDASHYVLTDKRIPVFTDTQHQSSESIDG